VTAVKQYKRHTSRTEMLDHRKAWLISDGPGYVTFKVWSRQANEEYMVTIRKSDGHANCPCKDRTGNCWHILLALGSLIRRVKSGEVVIEH
jgi:hypothetical protein